MKTGIDNLREWIENKYYDYSIDGEHVKGTYGLIWFLKANKASHIPKTRALKTLNPDNLTNIEKLKDVDYLRRELRMLMELPKTYNVISAIKIDIARLPVTKTKFDQNQSFLYLPVLMMERMEGDLRSWIGNESFGIVDRLLALAQAFNGLIYLYSNGFEGHGDLKPENFLYSNLKDKFCIDNESLIFDYPWIIKVADLGWADAWVEYGFTDKAFREYTAPERVKRDDKVGRFIPEKSDIFSMGIIASELLQGKHPANNLKSVKKSSGNWLRWVENHKPDLADINSIRLKNLILRCINPDFNLRPTAKECLDEICCELYEEHNLDVIPTLEAWRKDITKELGVSKAQHDSDVAIRTISLGAEQETHTHKKLENLINEIKVSTVETCADWAELASTLIQLYKLKNEKKYVTKINVIRDIGIGHLKFIFTNFNNAQLTSSSLSGFGNSFERLIGVISKLADITDMTYNDVTTIKPSLSELTLAAFAFNEATIARSSILGDEDIMYYLDRSIKHAPEEATPYFFRALWGYQTHTLKQKNPTDSSTIQNLVKDLERACDLAPGWEEPMNLLKRLQEDIG
jgi:serine/threonine protein kinase